MDAHTAKKVHRQPDGERAYDERIQAVQRALEDADAVLIGAGAGLSTAAGLDYGGAAFRREFADSIKRYGFTDLYSAGFYPFDTPEEYWAHWAQHIVFARFDPPALPLYRQLLELVGDKPYFVLTTNVDGQFGKAGFNAQRVFAVQGDYGLLQCAKGCHDTLYPDEALVRRMVAETKDCRVPTSLIPRCPRCGERMVPNLRADAFFVQDAAWYEANERFERFSEQFEGKQLVMLELGVGFNTPGIIRFPFERRTYGNPRATLVRMNKDYPYGPKETETRTIAFTEDMAACVDDVLAAVRRKRGRARV